MRNVVEVYCTVISWNYSRGTEEDSEASQACLGTSRIPNWRFLNKRQQCEELKKFQYNIILKF